MRDVCNQLMSPLPTKQRAFFEQSKALESAMMAFGKV